MSGKRLLAVDDQLSVLESVCGLLGEQVPGLAISVCGSWAEAWDLLVEACPPFDMVLSDENLWRLGKPAPDSGTLLLVAARGYQPGVATVLMSGLNPTSPLPPEVDVFFNKADLIGLLAHLRAELA